MSEQLNRYEQVAARLTREYGVYVEWAPLNREYVVQSRAAGRYARDARRLAQQVARRLAQQVTLEANTYGVLGDIA